VLDVTCEECGAAFSAKTRRAKFCKTSCRVAANRRPSKTGKAKEQGQAAGAVVEIGKNAPAPPPADPPKPTYDTLAEQVRESLTELKALDTISGMAALRIAQQLDRGGDNGSAVATLTKELSRLRAEARVEAAPRHRDGVTTIEERVAGKLLQFQAAQ
jgi:ATP-dependent exoDNAse (exonuclease V) alpha subunit